MTKIELAGGRVHLGEAREFIGNKRGRVEVYFDRRDLWIGVYVSEQAIYLCPLPVLVVRISRGPKWRPS
jgi:hypothetical protein